VLTDVRDRLNLFWNSTFYEHVKTFARYSTAGDLKDVVFSKTEPCGFEVYRNEFDIGHIYVFVYLFFCVSVFFDHDGLRRGIEEMLENTGR
jgi:hypothetical protein